jgi:GntP family gluconate:H+ symporter
MNPILIVLIGVAVVIGGILIFRLHAFLSLIAGAIVVAMLSPTDASVGKRLGDGFGNTAASVGILIAMAAILGKALMESGSAERIVLSLCRALGDSLASVAYLISGFVLAALVLSDTTFYLLIPLARVNSARTGKNYVLYVLSIVAGAVMTHSLVPPAAGPAMVAKALNVKFTTMMLVGGAVGAVASSSGFLYALWANRRWTIPLRSALGVSVEELERLAHEKNRSLPPLWLALVPIIVPVALITLGDIHLAQPAGGLIARMIIGIQSNRVIATMEESNIALAVGAAIGLVLVRMHGRQTRAQFSAAIGQALASAGVMVLIIAAGGAFGAVVKQTGIADVLRDKMPAAKLAILPLAFLITAAVRTAQGSAIVSMTTALSVVAPIATAGHLGFHPVYLATAIGCGSKLIPWMNDAGFWIVGQSSGMTEPETLKTMSVMMTIMGIVGLAATMLGAWVFPLV